eukprot:6111248-Heterocapsa_arctica.AAC.1
MQLCFKLRAILVSHFADPLSTARGRDGDETSAFRFVPICDRVPSFALWSRSLVVGSAFANYHLRPELL